MVAQAGRTVAPISAIAMDLDRFKALNDRYGHQAGDEALAAVGAALGAGIRASDFAGRWGGEEFVLLLPGTDADGAAALAEQLRELIAGVTRAARPDRHHGELRGRRAARTRQRRGRAPARGRPRAPRREAGWPEPRRARRGGRRGACLTPRVRC
jgi:GGDEF domain-containing protein